MGQIRVETTRYCVGKELDGQNQLLGFVHVCQESEHDSKKQTKDPRFLAWKGRDRRSKHKDGDRSNPENIREISADILTTSICRQGDSEEVLLELHHCLPMEMEYGR